MATPIDTQLREYSAYFDGLLEPVTVEDVLVERVSASPVQPLRPRRAPSRRGWLVAAGVAAVVIALVAAAGLMTRSRTAPAPPATDPPSPPPSGLPAPRPSDSGSIDTSLGTLRWSRYAVAAGPDIRFAEAPDGGLAAWSIESATYWTSRDGVEWTAVGFPVPIRAESVGSRMVGEAFWLQTINPTTLWRSADFQAWEQIDLAVIPFPESFNVDWTLSLGAMAGLEDGAAVTWQARPDVTSVGLEGPFTSTHNDLFLDPGGLGFGIGQPPYEVRGIRTSDGVEEAVAVVDIVPFGAGWRVVDVDTGAEYAYFAYGPGGPAVNPLDFWIEGLLLVNGAGDSRVVEPPWTGEEQSGVSLVGFENRLLAVTHSTTGSPLVRLWESEDGSSWRDLGRPSFMPPGSAVAYLRESGGVLYAHVSSEGAQEQLMSRDGVNWEILPSPVRASSDRVTPFLGGYAAWSVDLLWLSPDGIEWEEHRLGDFGISIDPVEFDGGFAGGLVGHRLVVRVWSNEPGGGGSFVMFVGDEPG